MRRSALAVPGVLLATVLVASACAPQEDSAPTGTRSIGATEGAAPGTASPSDSGEDAASAGPVASADGDPAVAAALATLDTLPVKGRAPKTGYERGEFGQAWADVDRNGCDTRNDILARDLTDVVLKEGSCRVLSGVLDDPYTGTVINFTRGQDTSTAVQIDHVVALSDAWQKGAQQLTPERREQLANDPVNLLAVDGPANMGKSDGDAATWLPPNKAFRCTYVSTQIEVKAAYALWVTQAERDAMVRVLSDCGGAGIGAGDAPGADGAGAEAPADVPAQDPAAPPAPEEVPVDPAGVYYPNCAAARAAGAAPLYRGEPGYRSGMDGDSDGVACE